MLCQDEARGERLGGEDKVKTCAAEKINVGRNKDMRKCYAYLHYVAVAVAVEGISTVRRHLQAYQFCSHIVISEPCEDFVVIEYRCNRSAVQVSC